MIPLAIRCDVADPHVAPFVTRIDFGTLRTSPSPRDARLIAEDQDRWVLQTNESIIGIFKYPYGVEEGDVLYVEPIRGVAQRWIRASSLHNTLLVTEQCDQLCIMCSQPPKKQHTDLFESIAAACLIAPQGMTIGLSGGEPTLYKSPLFNLLEQMALQRADLRFHVLSNGQHFEPSDTDILRRLHNTVWGVPLYAADSDLHDQIVGSAGAFARLEDGLSILGLSGAAIELRTVVTRRNI